MLTVLQIWGENDLSVWADKNSGLLRLFGFNFCFISFQTLFAGYTDNLIRVWQVTIGTR